MTAALALALALLGGAQHPEQLTLEIRTFRGTEDVTAESRVTVYRAGERAQPSGQSGPGSRRVLLKVLPGIYDAQAIQEREGRVINIRWAERLVVMPYPDEAGHHLEVINFLPGFGALAVRGTKAARPDADITLFPGGERAQPDADSSQPEKYLLFVVPAGQYDVQTRRGPKTSWHSGLEVPLDRTRLWIMP